MTTVARDTSRQTAVTCRRFKKSVETADLLNLRLNKATCVFFGWLARDVYPTPHWQFRWADIVVRVGLKPIAHSGIRWTSETSPQVLKRLYGTCGLVATVGYGMILFLSQELYCLIGLYYHLKIIPFIWIQSFFSIYRIFWKCKKVSNWRDGTSKAGTWTRAIGPNGMTHYLKLSCI